MKKMILPVLMAGLTMTACTKTEKTDDVAVTDSEVAAPETPAQDSTTVPVGDTTETSVDWNGTYTGKLPCASCPGIETTLTLNSDKTYTLDENYLEEKEGKFNSKGTFEFDPSGSYITLKNSADKDENRVFFIGENQAWMASKVGDNTMKSEYLLKKK